MAQASLISIEDAKKYIEVADGYDEENDMIMRTALSATAMIERYTRQGFAETNYSRRHNTRATERKYVDLAGNSDVSEVYNSRADISRYLLAGYPVVENTLDLRYDLGREFPDSSQLVADQDYYFDPAKNALYILRGLAKGMGTLKLEYTAGYAVVTPQIDGEANALYANMSASAPEDLKMACGVQMAYMYGRINTRSLNTRSEGGKHARAYAVTDDFLTNEAKAMVAGYVKTLMGQQ